MPWIVTLTVVVMAFGLAYHAAAGAELSRLERAGLALVALAAVTYGLGGAMSTSLEAGSSLYPVAAGLLLLGGVLDAVGFVPRLRRRLAKDRTK